MSRRLLLSSSYHHLHRIRRRTNLFSTLATRYNNNNNGGGVIDNNGVTTPRRPPIWKPQRVSCMWEEKEKNSDISPKNPDENHWLVLFDLNDGLQFQSERQLFNFYINYLARFLGSKEEAKKRIYLTSCGWCYGFGAQLDKDVVKKINGSLINLRTCQDHYYAARNKDLSGESGPRFNPLNRNRQLDTIFSYYHLSNWNLNWNHDHWLINMKKPEGGQKEMIDYCLKMLAKFVGSEEAAEEKIYLIWFKFPFGFGAVIDEETITKLKGFPEVLTVLPDYAFDTKVYPKQALNIFPSGRGIRFSYYYPTKAPSKNWLFDMEEYVDDSGDSIYSPLRFSRESGAFHRVRGGSDCKNWLITMEKTNGKFTSHHQRITCCVKTLATAIGSSGENVKRRIYRIKCGCDFIGFGMIIDEVTSNKLKGLPGITVVPDNHFDDARTEASAAQTAPQFGAMNRNARLNDMYSYQNSSERNPEWNHDHWVVHVKRVSSGCPGYERKTLESCIKLLAEVLGSEEEAKRSIYVVWSNTISGFGAEIDKATSDKLKARSDVLTVLPDYAFDVKNKASSGVLVISSATGFGSSWTNYNIFYRILIDDSPDSDSN